MIVHGGDVWQVAEEFGIPASGILDFSANINPRGLPPQALQRFQREASGPQSLSCYPDPSARRLRQALSEQLAVPAEAIAVGAGAEALLDPILRCLRPRRVLVPIPAFSEYRRVCERLQAEFVPFPLDRAELFRVPVDRLCRRMESEECDVVLLNNPHNPSGALLDRDEILPILDAAQSRGGTLLMDEAFIDYSPHDSLVGDAARRPGSIVLRSLTKFYGCPALRVGYVVAPPDTIERIRSLVATWPVTQLALDTLSEAVADNAYAAASLRDNGAERERLGSSLASLGISVFPPAANYLLLELRADMPSASELRRRLIVKHRILIRNCDSYEGLTPGRYVRVAVRSNEENHRLIEAMAGELSCL